MSRSRYPRPEVMARRAIEVMGEYEADGRFATLSDVRSHAWKGASCHAWRDALLGPGFAETVLEGAGQRSQILRLTAAGYAELGLEPPPPGRLPALRPCLRCGRTILSEHRGHRHCDDCREALARADDGGLDA
jgi:hypothetical protein